MQTTTLRTDTPADLAQAVARAVELLSAGEPVAVPSETVYGLAADALSASAAARIFEAKERPTFDPLICHLPALEWLEQVAFIPDSCRPIVGHLTQVYWPGPLTLVLPRRAIVPDLVTSGLETVAVRMPAHPVFQALLQHFGKPLAAPSANRFGRISPTAAEHVERELGGRIPLILDGGATEHGLESTILKVEEDISPYLPHPPALKRPGVRILRSGPITREALESFAELEGCVAETTTHLANLNPEAPGQLLSHYAPRTPLYLLSPPEVERARFARTSESGEAATLREVLQSRIPFTTGATSAPVRIGFLGWQHAPSSAAASEVLSPSGDLREAAATLFAKLRRLDEAGLDCIIAEPVVEEGLGRAIMDRLQKASSRPG